MTLHVDGSTGIVVVPPDSADVSGAIQQDEVVESCLLQTDRGRDATEAGADDRNVIVGYGAVGHRISRVSGKEVGRVRPMPAARGGSCAAPDARHGDRLPTVRYVCSAYIERPV